MPKIDAPTVKEHHEQKLTALVDAADDILRTEGLRGLTAAAVTERAGIARNSLYRYVESVGDLYAHVIGKVLPAWTTAVAEALSEVTDPADRLRVFVDTNLAQAASGKHGNLMMMASQVQLSPSVAATLREAHRGMDNVVMVEWRRLGVPFPELQASLTTSLVAGGFRAVDKGMDLTEVTEVVLAALDGMLADVVS